MGKIGEKKGGRVARRKAVGGERGRNVPDVLVERLERNSSTVDNQRHTLRVIPECPAERMNVDHALLTACDNCTLLTSSTQQNRLNLGASKCSCSLVAGLMRLPPNLLAALLALLDS